MRHEKITQPAAATAPKYSAPPVRSAPPMPRSPPLPPRISDYYDDENDSGILFTKFCYLVLIELIPQSKFDFSDTFIVKW